MGIKLGDNNKFEGPTNIGKDNTIKVEKIVMRKHRGLQSIL